MRALPMDLDPSGPEARQWLADELAKPDYADSRTIAQRILDWLVERIMGLNPNVPGVPQGETSPIWVALAIALVIGAIILILSRIRAERVVVEEQDRSVLGGLDLTAPQFRERGRAALAAGRWDEAVIEFTRAIAREASDRTLLSDAPSATAHEIGAQLAVVFPTHAAATQRSMDLFDAVRYGDLHADEPGARAVAALDTTLKDARPELASAGPAPSWGAL